MRVVDLFAGLGGMTCGALEAGASVVLAVDSDPTPLKVLGANAPATTTVVATLGEGRDEVSLPSAAPDLHVHLSTPCTELSAARRSANADTAAGLEMMRWAVDFVLDRNDCSWSLENVPTKATRELMTELAAAHPERVAFGVFDSAEFGAPQSRLRLIAGPPKLVRMLQGIPSVRRVSVRDAFEQAGQELPAAYYKNQTTRKNGAPTMRSVETQSFTVCAAHALRWCDATGQTVRVMTARDSATLMTFPSYWVLPKGCRLVRRRLRHGADEGAGAALLVVYNVKVATAHGAQHPVTRQPHKSHMRHRARTAASHARSRAAISSLGHASAPPPHARAHVGRTRTVVLCIVYAPCPWPWWPCPWE